MPSVLIDTSAWIEFFRPEGDSKYRALVAELIDDDEASLCGIILTELLKGARTDAEYHKLEDRLATLTYLETPESIWKQSGKQASSLLRKGIQVPTTDLVIAMVAMENHLPVLHQDKHFSILQKHTSLKILEP